MYISVCPRVDEVRCTPCLPSPPPLQGVINNPNTQGIIPRIIQDTFDHIYSMDPNLEIHIKVAFVEVSWPLGLSVCHLFVYRFTCVL